MTATHAPDENIDLYDGPPYRWNMRCPKCGRFVSNDHLNAASLRGVPLWEYCPRCLEKEVPGWQDLLEYHGLFCQICGEKSGTTDLCVDCCARIQHEETKREGRVNYEIDWY